MGLKFELDTLEGVDESLHGFYEEKDGKFRLSVEDLPKGDDGAELKEALRKEREERKSAKERLQQLEDERKQLEDDRAKEKGEFKTLYEKTQAELEQEREQGRKFRTTIQQKEQDGDALQIASQLTKDMSRANLLKKEVLQFSRYTDDGVKYEIGGVEVTKEKLVDKLREDYPFLVDGSQSTGGGANGSKGTGSQLGKKSSEMNNAEKSKYITDNGLAAWESKVRSGN